MGGEKDISDCRLFNSLQKFRKKKDGFVGMLVKNIIFELFGNRKEEPFEVKFIIKKRSIKEISCKSNKFNKN